MFESDEYAAASALRKLYKGEKMNKEFTGIIERLFVNDRKTAKGDKKSISIANNKVYYGLGLHDTGTYQVDGVTLKEGMEVRFSYEDGKYKNVILDTLKIVQQEATKEFKKSDNDKDLAIRLGNSVTIATHLTKSKLDIVAIAKKVMPMVDELRDKLLTKYPNMDQYGLKARLGQAAIISAQYTANINDFIGFAEELFEDICLAEEELKNSVVEKEKNNNKEEKVEEVKQPETEDNNGTGDWLDDIPF
jgi:hypothetical protein